MPGLDELPTVSSFFGIDLRTGSMIIGALGVMHPTLYGCTLFMNLTYTIAAIWVLVALYAGASLMLLFGIELDNNVLIEIWIWYTIVFVVLMLSIMITLTLLFTSLKQRGRAIVAIFGILWYILTIYFIVVVHSHKSCGPKPEGMKGDVPNVSCEEKPFKSPNCKPDNRKDSYFNKFSEYILHPHGKYPPQEIDRKRRIDIDWKIR